MSVTWRDSDRTRCEFLALDPDGFASDRQTDLRLGSVLVAAGEEQLGQGTLQARVEFGTCLDTPLLVWRVILRNASAEAVHLLRVGFLEGGRGGPSGQPILWEAGDTPGEGRALIHDLSFYTNGWQSWGYAGSLMRSDRAPNTRLGLFTLPRVNAGTPRPPGRGQFGSDMFGVLCHRGLRTGVLAGFLAQQAAFGSLLADVRGLPPTLQLWSDLDGVRLDPGAVFETDWACVQFVDLTRPEPVSPYLDAVARFNQARPGADAPVGWCSWYFFFEKVTQQAVLENLAWAAAHHDEVPLNLIQLDDGFEAQVGDWYDLREAFPDGLPELSRRIQSAGFRPGLWLAPFIAKPQARVLSDHPDWILRDHRGAPANAGFAWRGSARALDVTNPAVLDHVEALIQAAVRDWGFEYLKLDFLYAAALPGKRNDPRRTRAQALRGALERVRAAAGPETVLVGCGCPLGPAVGIVDGMRIGTDVAPRWEPAFMGLKRPFRREPDIPATRSAARNALTRSMLHRKWWVNDPDCLLMREPPTRREPGAPTESRMHLTASEVQFLATVVALSAGSLVVSDDLPRLAPERAAWLGRLIPPLPKAARVFDLFDAAYPSTLVLPLEGPAGLWHLVALLNWADGPGRLQADLLRLGLPQAAAYHAVDFWGESYRRIEGSSLLLASMPAHAAVLLAIRPATAVPCWLGDSLHISQGFALRAWEFQRAVITAEVGLGRVARGAAWLALPGRPTSVHFEGRPLTAQETHPGVYRIGLEVHNTGRLEIRLP